MENRPTDFTEEPRLVIEPGRAARVAAITSPGELADVISTYLDVSVEEKVELLGSSI